MNLALVMGFGSFLPYSKHFHIITGLPNVFLQKKRPYGELTKPDLEKEEFGVSTLDGFTWKSIFDWYIVHRVRSLHFLLPCISSGKPLHPKHITEQLRHELLDFGGGDLLLKMAEARAKGEEYTHEGPILQDKLRVFGRSVVFLHHLSGL